MKQVSQSVHDLLLKSSGRRTEIHPVESLLDLTHLLLQRRPAVDLNRRQDVLIRRCGRISFALVGLIDSLRWFARLEAAQVPKKLGV